MIRWKNASKIIPANNTKVLVELEDGTKTKAWQQFGEWPDDMKVRYWSFIEDDDLDCPFCNNGEEFDRVGLKYHLEYYCGEFAEIIDLEKEG